MQELMFSTSFDARDACSNQRAQPRGREAATKRGVEQTNSGDVAAGGGAGQRLNGCFDFREFWHG